MEKVFTFECPLNNENVEVTIEFSANKICDQGVLSDIIAKDMKCSTVEYSSGPALLCRRECKSILRKLGVKI
ncbi:MAG TPA: hypothetical protein ENN75_01515 [candidate division Zixibacteria bacterium]|nr:hypothetical protein [candidate division Zixibacteria bacterium]